MFSQVTESLSCDGVREELQRPWLHLLSTLAAANDARYALNSIETKRYVTNFSVWGIFFCVDEEI